MLKRPGAQCSGKTRERGAFSGVYSLLRDGTGLNGVSFAVAQGEKEDAVTEGEALFCKTCLTQITRKDQAIRINGSHGHTFFNPEGIVFEIGCFRDAPGCLSAGEATSEFTWFAGSVWRFALCRTCGVHLGWHYEMKESGFYGLVLARLRE